MRPLYIFFLLGNLILNIFFYLIEIYIIESFISFRLLTAYSSLLIFILIIMDTLITRNLFSLLVIFSVLFFFFLYGRIVLYSINPSDDLFTLYSIKEKFIGKHYIYIGMILSNIIIITVHIFFFIGYPTYRNYKPEIYESGKFSKLVYQLFLIFALLALIKFILEAKYIMQVGYTSVYIGGLDKVNYYSPLVKNAHNFLLLFYGLLLQNVPNKKKFIICSSIFILTNLISSLKGARILFLLPFLYTFWYYFRFYSRFSIKRQVWYGFIVSMLVLVLLIGIRQKRSTNDFAINNPFSKIEEILKETGSTLQIVASYIKSKNEIKSDYPFVLEPIIYPYFYLKYHEIMSAGQSVEMHKIRNSLNHRLAFHTSKNAYLKGNALGSSIVSEAYQFGLIYLIFISIVYGRFMLFLEKKLKKGSMLLLLSPVLLPTVMFAARTSPFPNTWGILKFLAMYLIFYYLLILFKTFSIKDFKNNFEVVK